MAIKCNQDLEMCPIKNEKNRYQLKLLKQEYHRKNTPENVLLKWHMNYCAKSN